ncbi:MAG: hypothetical protein LBS60_03190 [Deltaproteobacteria bacterium]|jgi:hypothetical protein|nr:hypothetical protein [Deltaproteobacteria bacterium]
MGEIFYATIYDIKDMTRFSMCVDKFHANCYSYSGAVVYAHYLLRQKPYRVMWFSPCALQEGGLNDFSEKSDLLGVSASIQYDDFLPDIDVSDKNSRKKLLFIRKNRKRWRSIKIRNKAMEYFNYDKNRSVLYSGFLLNHTKKLAINLSDYLQRSLSMFGRDFLGAIDLIPVLTDTCGGSAMAFFDGISWDTTEELSAEWRGDLLQIVDEPPANFKIINCCFASIWDRANACRSVYGVDSFNYILGDKNGNRYECAKLNLCFERGPRRQVKIEFKEKGILFTAEIVPESI